MVGVLALLFVFTVQAQDQKMIKGIVRSEGNPVPNATVSLLKQTDRSLVKLALTNVAGEFEFSVPGDSSYLLTVSSIGFDSLSVPAQINKLNQLEISRSAESLTAVTVAGRRPMVEARLDKMVVNVDASPTNTGTNALELLAKSPGISVDRDGNISLKGKQGVMVLIDGKQTYLSAEELASYLRSLPSSQLDQIEIMTQPSAKFDAAGNSGVINLKTKKNRQMGFNGSVTVSYAQGNYPKSPNSFNFNYKKGRVNLFTNGGYTYWQMDQTQLLYRRFHQQQTVSRFDQVGTEFHASHGYNARVGLDYTVNPKTTIGFVVNGNYSLFKGRNYSLGNFYDEGKTTIDSSILAENYSRNPWNRINANANFRRSINKEGREITADIDYIKYHSKRSQYTDNRSVYPNQNAVTYLLRADLPANISIYSAKVDYVHPLNKQAKIEAGLKSSFVETDNNAPYETFDDQLGKWVDDRRKDHFIYEERISAAYLNFSQQLKKWSFQGGLRGEHTESTGKQVLISKKISKSYLQLFPTAYIAYAMNDKNQFSVSYGRRIGRPNYRDLNPFQYFLDLYTYNQGNPYLAPQFTHNTELTHIFKGRLSTTLNYTYTTDIINDILKQDDESKVTYQTKENVATRSNLGIALSYNAPITSWWTTSLFGNLSNQVYKGMVNNRMLKADVSSYMFNFTQQFKFAKTWGAEISGFYQSKNLMTSMFLLDPIYSVSFGASKQILKNKGSLKLSVNDPFKLEKVDVSIKHDNIDMVVKNRWDNRRVALSFTYRFSKGESVSQQRKTGSAQEEQKRIGN